MKQFRKAAPVALLAVTSLALGACASSDRADTPKGSGGAAASGGTLTFGAAGAPKLFDPFYATDGETFRVTRQMFEGLLTDKAGTAEVVPGLAAEMPTSDDGKVWTFKLRTGVKFTDGTDFNAEAVCKNFERWFDQNKASQSGPAEYWSYTMGAFKDNASESLYKGCEAVDPATVKVSVNSTTSKFPTVMSLASYGMQSPTAMEKGDANNVKAQGEGFVYPAYAQNPVGTGPFKLDKYDQANKTVTLSRNDGYWGNKAKVDKLVFKIIPDESTRRQELQAGSIDGYDLPNPVDWKGLKDAGNQVLVRPAFNILYMGFNLEKNPKLADLKVRQALDSAVNREQMVKTQLPEGATAASQFMPDTVNGYDKDLKVTPYDPEKAKKLLKEAGAEGMTLNFAYPTEVTRPYMPNPQKIFEALRSDFEKVGIKVKVTAKPWNGGYLDGIDAGAFDAFLIGWTGDYSAPDNFIGTFFAPKGNDFRTHSQPWGKTLSKDLVAADAIVDEAERNEAYAKITKQINDEYIPGLPLSSSPPALVVGPRVKGLIASPLTAEDFSLASVEKK